jgi:hypothetical protein
LTCITLLAATAACKQTYLPPIIKNPPTWLVVEGFINNGPDSTWFNLTHTYQLNGDSTAGTPELGAIVTIQGNDNTSYTLYETANTGLYTAHLPALNPNTRYRLYISTTSGNRYASDFVPLVSDPPIDSINLIHSSAGAMIYTNTHDPSNSTHDFRWEYQETWEFTTYQATLKWTNNTLVNYGPDTTYICWKADDNTNIILATSTRLAEDVIYEEPLVSIPQDAEKLGIEYSINVLQYSLTDSAFNWWSIMQNNTENIGSIFGVQPITDQGNLHCLTDTSQQVVGYVSAGTLRTQRVFFTNAQVQPWYYQPPCNIKKVDSSGVDNWFEMGYLPVALANNGTYAIAYADCVDCTLTGSNKKPYFWH